MKLTKKLLLCTFSSFFACFFEISVQAQEKMLLIQNSNSNETSVLKVTLRSGEHFFDFRQTYLQQALNLALQKTIEEGPFEVVETDSASGFLSTNKAFSLLEANRVLTVEAALTNKALESKFVPARVCLKFGTIGKRVFLTRKENKDVYSSIKTVKDILKIPIGSGESWADTLIMKSAGMNVVTSSKYAELFDMLMGKRFDLLTRAPYEALDEMRNFGNGDLALEPNLLLSYPAADYFFFNKKNEKIAQRVERGLLRAKESGELFELFWQNYGSSLLSANLLARKQIEIPNPTLPLLPPAGEKNWEFFERESFKLISSKIEKILNSSLGDEKINLNTPLPNFQNSQSLQEKVSTIRIFGAEFKGDIRLQYFIRLAELAIKATPEFGAAKLESVDYSVGRGLDQKEALDNLEDGNKLDLVGSTFTTSRAEKLQAVRVPLHLGLLGQRVLVYHSKNSKKILEAKTAQKLRKLKFCIGTSWPEKQLMGVNKLNYHAELKMDELYQALKEGKCDVLSRAIFEAFEELRIYGSQGFELDKKWRVSYPIETVFYVKKGNAKLAKRMEIGLQRVRATGEFENTFKTFFGESIVLSNLINREVLEIEGLKETAQLKSPGVATWAYLLNQKLFK